MPNAMIGTGSKDKRRRPLVKSPLTERGNRAAQVPILKLTRSQRAKCAGVPCRGGIRVFFSGGLILRPRLEGSAPARAAACEIVERRATVDEDDGVDGPCSPASRCHNVVVAERHNERSHPPCKLARSGWISPRESFRSTASTPPARL